MREGYSKKNITFYTIHQAPHNTFMFKELEKHYSLHVFFLRNKLKNYNWQNENYYYFNNNSNKNLFKRVLIFLNSDFIVLSGWQSYKYIFLMLPLFLLNKRWAVYLDLDIKSLKKYGLVKKILLKLVPYIFITGIYGESFLKRYLKKENIFNMPYAVKSPKINFKNNKEEINNEIFNVFISNRFIHRKGYSLIRYLLENLKSKELLSNFNFTIAGNGPLFEKETYLIKLIEPKVNFLGWIEYDEYLNQMSLCDIYLHCSEYEPYGIPPVDAFLRNKIIVATRKVYSIYDIKEMGGIVYDFDYNLPFKLFEIFENIIISKSKLRNQIDINLKFDEYPFSEIYLNVFQKVLA